MKISKTTTITTEPAADQCVFIRLCADECAVLGDRDRIFVVCLFEKSSFFGVMYSLLDGMVCVFHVRVIWAKIR